MEELGESRGLGKTLAGGNRDVSLQNPDRSRAVCPNARGPEDRNPCGLRRDQLNDGTGNADLAARSIKVPCKPLVCP